VEACTVVVENSRLDRPGKMVGWDIGLVADRSTSAECDVELAAELELDRAVGLVVVETVARMLAVAAAVARVGAADAAVAHMLVAEHMSAADADAVHVGPELDCELELAHMRGAFEDMMAGSMVQHKEDGVQVLLHFVLDVRNRKLDT
jgi:hypothetical protein